ncbi:hypothetical protein [uncultured Roseobacter sp.]|uniref:ImuA family protein n=1 Tax=uncultured Roseobacter sp. TaxID=114847 RepID=UPI00260F0140|nr:hypothetical protein [uncultured Roseobacter sp.]
MSAYLSSKRLSGATPLDRRAQVALSEVFPTTVTDASATGFVLSRLRGGGPVLWVQDRLSRKEAGVPYLPGLRDLRGLPDPPGLQGLPKQQPVIQVNLSGAADVLWAMEEGLGCKTLCAVIGEIWGTPPALSFTATKRLALRAETAGVACWLIRRAAEPGLSAARERWRVGSLPAAAHPDDAQAPGTPRWQAELFKSRSRKPGIWVIGDDGSADPLPVAAPFRDGTLAETRDAERRRAQR